MDARISKRLLIPLICALCALSLAACKNDTGQGDPPLQQKVYNGSFTSFDGTKIAFTVFQPKLAKGQPAPLVLDSPGFGGSRYQSLAEDSSSSYHDPTKTAAREAWQHGYFVITFDQRGFGDSGGTANVEDPNKEGRDISQLLDWAESHLGPHLAYRNGSPVVGALGYSYGGGYQLIGAAVDPRFNAIVPTDTWNNLIYSLDPRGGLKTDWATLLILDGDSGGGKLAPFIYKAFAEGLTENKVDQTILHDDFYLHSLQSFCDGAQPSGKGTPHVATFLVQGSQDTLFNMNEAVRNADCLRQAGNTVKVLIQRKGHTLPVVQGQLPNHQIGFEIDQQVKCGNQTFNTGDLMFDFLNKQLKGIKPSTPIPDVCIVQDDTHGLDLSKVPVGGSDSLSIPQTTITSGPPPLQTTLALITENSDYINTVISDLQPVAPSLTQTLQDALGTVLSLDPTQAQSGTEDLIADLLGLLPPQLLDQLSGPTFVPLFTAATQQPLAGLPAARLQLAGTASLNPRIYVGIGIKRAGAQSASLLDSQVTPIAGVGDFNINLNGVSTELQPEDEVGLMLYGFQPQYASSFARQPSQVKVSGSLSLPLPQQG